MDGDKTADVTKRISTFVGDGLTQKLSAIEARAGGVTSEDARKFIEEYGVEPNVLMAAGEMKKLSSQIDVIIHALGILLSLSHILEPDERVEYLSLGAGNTGRQFDLETNFRIAEFKFIKWRGGAESIRQNSVFKDFFLLAESDIPKRKFLYLLGTEHAYRFLNGGRALKSVLSKDQRVRDHFVGRFGDKYQKVKDCYRDYSDKVSIVDVSKWLEGL